MGAFAANLKAYAIDPWLWESRLQLSTGFSRLSMMPEVRVSREAADLVYKIGLSTSRYSPSVLTGRAFYLIRDGKPEEVEAVLYEMRGLGLQIGFWLLEALYAAKVGNGERLRWAIENGKRHGNQYTPGEMDILRQFEKTLERND